MKNLEFKIRFENTTINSIKLIEKEFKINMPNIFKEYILSQNGGCQGIYRFKTESDIYSLTYLFPLKDYPNSIQDNLKLISSWFGKNCWLPFGNDSGDLIYCISLKPHSFGQVYLLRLDEEYEKDAFIYICESFKKFIDGLKTDEEMGF